MSEPVKKGKYVIQKLSIIRQDNKEFPIDHMFTGLNYTESVFDGAFSYGSLELPDDQNLVNLIPIVGEEKLVFEYKVTNDSEPIKKNFFIYKVSTDHKTPMVDTKHHTIFFASEEIFYDRNTIVSKSFKNMTSEAIVSNLFDMINGENKEQFNSSVTFNQHHFIIPNLHPIEAINLVAGYTQHPSYKGGGFFFYQNAHGFNFFCLEEMFDKKSLGKFRVDLQVVEGKDIERFNTFEKFEPISGSADTLSTMGSGLYGNKYIAYDPLVKTYKEFTFSYNKGGFDETTHLNKFKLNTDTDKFDSVDQRVVYIPSNTLRKSSSYYMGKIGSNISSSKSYEEFAPIKASLIEQILTKRYRVILKGDDVPSLFETPARYFTVGETLEINHTARSSDRDRDNQDDGYISGKYLIGKCRHIFTSTSYSIEAELFSDSNSAPHEKG